MSTIHAPSSVSTSPRLEPCWTCGHPIPSDGVADPHLCDACRRMKVDTAILEIRSAVRSLRDGDAKFDDADPRTLMELGQLLFEASGSIGRKLGLLEPAPAVRREIEEADRFDFAMQ